MFGEITCNILVVGMLVTEKVIKQPAVVETVTTEAELPYFTAVNVSSKNEGPNAPWNWHIFTYIIYMIFFNLW